MTTADKEIRRIRVRSAFKDCGFELVDGKAKADMYRNGAACIVYFRWNQSKELNLSIDPNINYLTLLELDGVSIPETLLKSVGLRAGTATKELQKSFGTFTPANSQSHVSRMFEVREVALPSFLRALISSIDSTEKHLQIKGISSEPNVTATSTQDEQPNPSTKISDLDTSDSRSQGYESDPVLRQAIEQYAVAKAIDHYSKNGYKVTELGKPFDLLLCVRSADVIHVEVKGSRSMLNAVILTVNEVKHARIQSWRSDLFIVEGICIDVGSDAKPIARAGSARVLKNWDPKEVDLSPSRFSYSLPILSEWVPIPFET